MLLFLIVKLRLKEENCSKGFGSQVLKILFIFLRQFYCTNVKEMYECEKPVTLWKNIISLKLLGFLSWLIRVRNKKLCEQERSQQTLKKSFFVHGILE